ncbi:MAG: helix-turn-helix domain-containing protein [Planctomycetaceae bacterium]|jgi:predicted XRE-type DNA-binding protein|nr:helix-turn-helix domain-containing protein [Planctomycetaceae bacterium]
MDAKKRKAIEAAGWKVGDAADFLEMSTEERQLLDTRIAIAQAIRLQRESRKMSQQELGAKMKTSQPRVAKIERAAPDVSLDQLVRALATAGGKIVVTSTVDKVVKRKVATKSIGEVVLELTVKK